MTIYRDDLERVYALIEAPERWTQHTLARGKEGEYCGPLREEAACWCLIGATYCVLRNMRVEVMDDLEKALGMEEIGPFNDSHTHAEVLQLLRAAIDRAPVRP